MKKAILFSTIILLFVAMFSCTLRDDENGGTNPTEPVDETLEVTSPKSGDTLYANSAFDIKWTSNTNKNLFLEYTLNNGKDWSLIKSNIENTGSYIWSPVPNTTTTEGRIRVSTFDSSKTALSDGLFNIVPSTTKTLVLIVPNGGEVWKGNSSQVIKWTSSGIDSVTLEYTIDNGMHWQVIAAKIQSTGFYEWFPLPNVPSTNAKVRITDAEEGYPLDESDESFSIEPEDLLTITMPAGGEEWLAGSGQYIKWVTKLDVKGKTISDKIVDDVLPIVSSTKTNSKFPRKNYVTTKTSPNKTQTIENVKIEYSVNGGANWKTIVASIENTGLYFWSSIPVENSSQCLIRVSDAADGVPFDFNDEPFSIYTSLPQEITITSPNGGEQWAGGTSQEIKWTSKDVTSVKIEYTINNGVTWNTIVASTPSDGAYTWEQLPKGSASNCRIKISDAADGTPVDMSDELFSILPEPNISLTSPNGGETLQSGSSINITWVSENIAKIKLEYTLNGGAEWILIADNIESTGSYRWENIPDANSNQVKIRISDSDDGMPFDVSDQNLSISNQIVQSLEVTSPNGSELWEANTSKQITWNSSAVTHVKIEFSSNNGLTWTVVENNLLSSGSYDWTVPNINTTQAKIRISDAVDGNPIDESNATFRIKQAGTLKLKNPESGNVWIAGELNRIEWDAQNVEKVKIEYTTTNAVYDPNAKYFDDEWFELVANAPGASGFYETRFTIPSEEYRIRISDAEFNEPVDFSGLFTVKGQPTYSLTLTTPNGGENWLIGEPYEIRWTSENITNVSLDYSLNNGASWTNIVNNIVSNGLYNWVIPSNIQYRSDLCKIRIRSASDSTIFDLSDASFTIHPKNKLLRVITPNGGEKVNSGKPTRIEWVSTGVEKVNIYFTIDNGTSWNKIIENYESTGAYMWTPPDTSSSLGRMKIVDSSDPSIVDESDSYFSIIKETDGMVKVRYPNGGEQLQAGGTADIKWLTQNVKNIKIEYSSNNGADWVVLVTSTPTEPGYYKWNPVPDIQTSHGIIRISDASRSDINDISDSTFIINNSTVVSQTLTLITPNGGENWVAGETHQITWTSSNIDNVDIEYSVDNGNSWQSIATNKQNTGTYTWIIPDNPSTSTLVRVKDAVDGDPVDESDATLTIKPLPSIMLISPNGGEVLTEGSKKPITWTSKYVQNVRIEFSANNGGTWTELIASTPSDGSWTWDPVSSTISDLCAIRISDASRTDIFDISETTFSIEEKIDQIAGEPASIFFVSQSVDAIGVTESGSPETAQIVFEVQDSSGVPIDVAHAVEVSFKFGSHPNGGEILAPTTVKTDENGQAVVNLTSGTIAGPVQVIAKLTDASGNIITSKPVNIAIHGGLPDVGHFSIGPNQVNYPYLHQLGKNAEITAIVGDKYANPVRKGTAVYFTTDAGVIEGSNLTDALGKTTVTLISGNPQPNDPVDGPGFFYVHARTIDDNNQEITTKTRLLYSGYTQITNVSPTTFDLANNGSQAFVYTVTDENGNPLALGNEITVKLETEGSASLRGDVKITTPDIQSGNTTFNFEIYDTDPVDKQVPAVIIIDVAGPNGTASYSISGTVR